jgi:hypothetical protein
MMAKNTIVDKQNSEASIKRLAAQQTLYSAAKFFFGAQLMLSVPAVIFISLAALAFDKQWFGIPKLDIAWLVGVLGMMFLAMDLLIWNPVINRYREKAAKIQQCFDSEVLGIPWCEITYGKVPDQEDIEEWAKKCRADYSVTRTHFINTCEARS